MICNLSDLKRLCPPKTCLLGIDPGSVVVGLAISDPDWRVASPLVGLEKGKFSALAPKIANIVKERNVGGLIVGLPKNMDGTEGPSSQAARTFASNLKRSGLLPNADMPIVFWDERLSTAAVTRFMISDDLSRKRRDATIDKAAAAYILQGALDALARTEDGK
jgi:putative Holliday junction resolvase